ncbi:MAG: hypothetical protein RL071_4887, partial [Pseudomonadota bacterium]
MSGADQGAGGARPAASGGAAPGGAAVDPFAAAEAGLRSAAPGSAEARACAAAWRALCAAHPRQGRAWRGLGRAMELQGAWPAARAAHQRALSLDPGDRAAALGEARCLRGAGDAAGAARLLAALLAEAPGDFDGQLLAADWARAAGDRAAERAALGAALAARPGAPLVARRAMALALQAKDPLGAAKIGRAAVAAAPTDPALWQLVGEALRQAGAQREAEEALLTAVRLQPTLAAAWDALGLCRRARGDLPGALAAHQRALALAPETAGLRARVAGCMLLLDHVEEAVELLRAALARGEPMAELASLLLQPTRMIGDWDQLDALRRAASAKVDEALRCGRRPPVLPIHEISSFDDPQRNLAVARAHCPPSRGARPRAVEPAGPLRLLVHSHDLRNHPIGHLTAGLFGRIDRARFEVAVLSTGPDDGSPYRARIAAGVDRWLEGAGLAEDALAEAVRAEAPHIFIDLMGHTTGHRLGLFARRLAPLQLSYLGYPGTTGADFFDGIIVDRVLGADPAQFSEPVLCLDGAYQPTDGDQPTAAPTDRRADHGLPEEGLVLCSFNQLFKLDPEVFDLWMGLLVALPSAVLWLLDYGPLARRRLCAAAEARGVAAERIVFAPFAARPAHLNRLGHADLALDPLVYGGHTTTSDALWAGVPVVTVRGRHFASRVCWSLLEHAGLGHLAFADAAALRAA